MARTIDPKELRNAFGSFATGVTIISYTSASGQHSGMTVNSFASVSLDPPLLSWNLQKNSDCYDDVMGLEHYAVNVLSSEQSDISNSLARKNMHELNSLDGSGLWEMGEYCPIIKNSLACFECRTWKHCEGGDHIILLGEVLCYERNEGAPLLFFAGNYAALK
jgi:3-hydroxy-9,10-secoandrosta-1,3,5(10)-triene-9,17-dione monooxygenase reductase component